MNTITAVVPSASPMSQALRDLADLLDRGALRVESGGLNIAQENHHGTKPTTITITSDLVLRASMASPH